jgi:hypothetical protein
MSPSARSNLIETAALVADARHAIAQLAQTLRARRSAAAEFDRWAARLSAHTETIIAATRARLKGTPPPRSDPMRQGLPDVARIEYSS